MAKITPVWVASSLCLLSAGCFYPPVDEKQPTYPMKETWQNPELEPTISSKEKGSPDNWWEVFGDSNLNAIVAEGVANSPTIEQALARFDQALAFVTVAQANQFPQLTLNGYGDRRRIPKDLQGSASVPTGNLLTPTTTAAIPAPNTGVPPIVIPSVPQMQTVKAPLLVNDLIANFLVSYELDFWGKYSLQTRAAVLRAQEAQADLATAQLLLVDQIASTYFTMQAMEAELALIRDEIAMHRERNALLAQQVEQGLTDAFQLLDEQATLETRLQDEQSLIQSLELNNSLLATLVGKEPNNALFEISSPSWTFPVVPAGLPSSLLAKRPDVQSAMREVNALIAEIGVAKTALLPSISLSAAAGFQAGTANQWFKWKDRIWDLAGSVGQILFDAGQTFAQIDAAKARYRQAAGVLTQTVLSSVKEVEDALCVIRTQDRRTIAALKREEDLAATATLRSGQCQSGLQDYLIVLQAKEDRIQASRARVNEEYNLQLSTLALMKGLGGSW